MAMQLNLPFGPSPFVGKKTQRITITCSSEFEDMVKKICSLTNESPSEMGQRYFIEGMQRDLGNIFMAEPHLNKAVGDLLSKRRS